MEMQAQDWGTVGVYEILPRQEIGGCRVRKGPQCSQAGGRAKRGEEGLGAKRALRGWSPKFDSPEPT